MYWNFRFNFLKYHGFYHKHKTGISVTFAGLENAFSPCMTIWLDFLHGYWWWVSTTFKTWSTRHMIYGKLIRYKYRVWGTVLINKLKCKTDLIYTYTMYVHCTYIGVEEQPKEIFVTNNTKHYIFAIYSYMLIIEVTQHLESAWLLCNWIEIFLWFDKWL